MEEVSSFLEFLAKGTPLILGLLAMLAFYYREKIKQILSLSSGEQLEKIRLGHAQELAELSARLQRDLESYRTSLIAESEKIKALQQVKTSLAVKIAERKFTTLCQLQDAHMGLDIHLGTLLSLEKVAEGMETKSWKEKMELVMSRADGYREAMYASQLFVSRDLHEACVQFRLDLVKCLGLRMKQSLDPISHENQAVNDMLQASMRVERLLTEALGEFDIR